LRDEYLELFRRALSDGAFEAVIDYPELGEADLATVVRSLSDSNEDRVLAALELLSVRGHARLVPVAILEHESPKVVCEALRILVGSGRVSAIPFANRLMDTGVPEVRAAAVRAIAELGPDSTTLRRAMESEDLGISTAAMVGLVGCGELDAYDAAEALGQQLDSATESERAAVAAAIATVPDRAFAPILERILREPGDEARRAALEAMREAENPMLVPAMIEAIDSRATREEARKALLVLGDIALDRLAATLREDEAPLSVRSQVPHSIARFGSDRAAGLLLRRVAEGMTDPVGYQSLRAVGRMFDEDETLSTSPEGLEALAASTLCEIAELIDRRVVLFGGDANLEKRSGPWLLHRALVDRQARLTECVFRILGLRYRDENLEHVYHAAVHGSSAARAGAHEILFSSLDHDLAKAVVALTDEISDEAKLAGLSGYYVPEERTAEDALTSMARGRDVTLAELAVYAAAERYSLDLRDALPAAGDASNVLSAVHDEAGVLLSDRGPAGEAG
jgi:HEAT repeat protein